MKYLKYTVLPLLLLAAWSCKKDTPTERPVTEIEFNFVLEGEPVDTMTFSSNSQTAEVGVSINNDNLNWTVTSDKSWCTVENGTGRGSGNFEIVLDLNESFNPRDTAVLTFTAGEYVDEKTLAIVQLGTDFILSQSLFLSARNGQTFTGTAKADTSDVLTVNCPEWVTYEKTKETVSKGIRTTTFKLTTEENTAEARTGRVYFSKDGGETSSANAYIHQFGKEMNYDTNGYMLMPAGIDSTFSFDVPNDILDLDKLNSGHSGKDYVNITATEGLEYTTVYVTFEDNLNDCMENRTAKGMFLTLNNKARANIPTLFQPYESCYGINTEKGLLNFAKAVNTGGDITPWMKDSVVHVLTSIDMTSVTKSWPGIGNEAHPFTGKFDGGYYPISSISSSNPLFGVCDNAEIQAVKLDESNKFLYSEDPTSESGIALASIAGKITGTVIKDCSSSAAVTLGKAVPGENISIYVAGLVGCADASSSITGCENFGKVTTTTGLETSTEDNIYVAGIVACSGAPVKKCTNSGAVSDGAAVYSHYVGGICGDADAAIEECESGAAITISSVRVNPSTGTNDQSRNFKIGGIAGRASADIIGCTNSGGITNNSNIKNVEIGGIAGEVDTPLLTSLTGNVNSGNISSTSGVRYLTIGGLYGTLSAEQKLTFSADSETSLGNISITEIESYSGAVLCAGGYVGRIKGGALTIKNAIWSKTISATLNKSAHTLAYLAVGGILGGSDNPTLVSNPYDITLDNCQFSNAAINFTLSSSFAYGARLGTIAGIVGTINGNATITNCITTGSVFIGASTTTASAKQNGYPSIVSGIAGCILNGNATIKECTNNVGMRNWTYNNNAWDGTFTMDSGITIYTGNVTAGILGSYLGPDNADGYSMAITDCKNDSYIYSYRGLAGGIAGYARDAKISGCTNDGSLGSGNRSYVGGIACLGNSVEINGCSAVCPLTGQVAGSAFYSSGGILAIGMGTGSITGCSYYGDINDITDYEKLENREEAAAKRAWGAVIGHITTGGGTGAPSYTVSASKWGGTLSNRIAADPVELTADNFREYAVGTCTLSAGTVTVSDDCEWWDGQ